MDEVGRGTTVKDGLAIAFAAIHHLVTVNECRCLFATHFHELADMVGNLDGVRGSGIFQNVRFFCSDVDEVGVRLTNPSSGPRNSMLAIGGSLYLFPQTTSWSQSRQSRPEGSSSGRNAFFSHGRGYSYFVLVKAGWQWWPTSREFQALAKCLTYNVGCRY